MAKIELIKLYIGEFHDTEPKIINLDYLYNNWDIRFSIHEWRADNHFSLSVHPKRSSKSYCKWTILEKQARKIIADLGLVELNRTFKSAFEYRTKLDWIKLEFLTFPNTTTYNNHS